MAKLLAQRCGTLPPRDLTTVAVIEANDNDLSKCEPVFRADRTLMKLYGAFWKKNSTEEGIAIKADTLITSIGRGGPIPEDNFFVRAGLVKSEQISEKVKGNIIGNLFDDKANQITLENKGKKRQVIGPTMNHIKTIAERHKTKSSNGAGVVMIVAEKSKASSIKYLAENNCINELIVDFDTAKAVLE